MVCSVGVSRRRARSIRYCGVLMVAMGSPQVFVERTGGTAIFASEVDACQFHLTSAWCMVNG